MRTPSINLKAPWAAPVGFDPVEAYRLMVRMRLVDEALAQAWADGLVPGEYHSGIGEEAINAGILLHLSGRDTMALDHRNTPPLIGRGADPKPGRVVVVDEDYIRAGLTGEIAALLLESGTAAKFARVAVETTIPFAPHLEYAALPNVERIVAAVAGLE
jgi:TPP-dependent pyruvate/acetoin dehydrogenase alpha subunit